ncbi:PKD domain-containing protein [Hymenobacter sp. BT186]|uniref:PKD domain-containing protein n=1 Tax=Hymenobacter telluris TaxID=2816474 RepID=A0A939JEP4_9BACT|nr:PKD domain-containing protein [Hymenobacter telluris]MBO0359607.1 PKD domain-containing protein [Hymenobacter telluris]MBW3375634.1 PKD domain-containing protein [Hymenobacter norwichensis]
MNYILNKATLAVLAGALLLTACDKEDEGKLEGPKPESSFTASAPRVVGLTSEVTFTSTSTSPDAFLYQWDFGDGTIGSGKTVTHVYTQGGTFKVKLTTAGRAGTTVSATQDVVIASTLNLVNQLLTGGSSRTWMIDNAANAPITVGTEAAPATYFAGVAAGALPTCQSDDEYTFSTSNTFTYNAKAQTFSAAAGYICTTPESGTSPFVFAPAVGTGLAQFTLSRAGAFIAATDASPTERVYRILTIDSQKMTLRAGSGQNGGTVFTIKMVVKP